MARTDRQQQMQDIDMDKDLEVFFEAARAETPVPREALLSRILADAAAHQPPAPGLAGAGGMAGDAPAQGWLARLFGTVGGWPALAGMVTATVAGVWIGYAEPAGFDNVSSAVWPGASDGYDVVDLIPSMDGFLVEDGA